MSSGPNPLLDSLLAGKGMPTVGSTAPITVPVVGVVVPAQGTAPAPAAQVKDLLGSLLAPRAAAPAAAAPPSPPAAAPPSPAAAAPPSLPASMPNVGPVVSSLSALLNPAKAAEPLPVVVPPSAFQAAAIAAGYPVDFKPTGSISPPDAPPRTSTPEQVAEADAGNKEKPPEAETEETEAEAAAAAAPGAPATPGRRKRRTKAEMEAARAAEAVAVAQAAGVPVVQVPAETPTPADLLSKLGMVAGPASTPVIVSTAAEARGAYTQAMTEEFSQAQTATPAAITGDLTSPAPAPVDPALAQIQHRLKTADPQFACGTKFVFVDCLPGKGWPEADAPVDVREFWHAITGNASACAKVADYRFIPYESKAYLSASVRTMLRGLPSCIYVDSSIPDIQELLTAVIPYASLVVHGR